MDVYLPAAQELKLATSSTNNNQPPHQINKIQNKTLVSFLRFKVYFCLCFFLWAILVKPSVKIKDLLSSWHDFLPGVIFGFEYHRHKMQLFFPRVRNLVHSIDHNSSWFGITCTHYTVWVFIVAKLIILKVKVKKTSK